MTHLLTLFAQLDWLEAAGLVTGLLAVWLLIRQNLWTWPVGVAYVLISLYIFWQAKLYADLALHLVYLALNLYGWWYWVRGGVPARGRELPVTTTAWSVLAGLTVLALVATAVSGHLFARFTDASLPYWDNATTMFSFAGMWLTAHKKLESWVCWLLVDIVATGIYAYKGLPFYTLLYLIYVGMAVAGWVAWRRTMDGPEPARAPATS